MPVKTISSTRKHDRKIHDSSALLLSGIMALLIIAYGFAISVSFVGNFLVLWIVCTTKSLQTMNNFLISSLSISHIIIAVICTPLYTYAALVQRWDLPEIMCKICPFVQNLAVNGCIFTAILIANDRYIENFCYSDLSNDRTLIID